MPPVRPCGALLALSTLAARVARAHRPRQIDVAGVKLDDTIDLRGSKLQLNGAGVRYKAVFKVYTAGPLPGQEGRHARRSAGRAGRQAHDHHHAARHRRQRTRQAVHARRGRQLAQERVVAADPRPAAHGPDVRRPEAAEGRRQLHDRLGAGHRHRDHGARACRRASRSRSRPSSMRWCASGSARRPADWKLKDALLGKPSAAAPAKRRARRVDEAVRVDVADRLAVVVAVADQHDRAAGRARGLRRRCSSRRPSACAPAACRAPRRS